MARVASRQRAGRRVALAFLAPAVVILAALIAYPIGYTVWLSLHGPDGGQFVGLANYVEMFTARQTRRAIGNNVIWVAVAPSVVTTLGLVLAVLTERIRLATAFKMVLFMPMAISFLAAGVTFRLVYDEDPARGLANAALVAVHDSFAQPSRYHGAVPREGTATVAGDGAMVAAPTVRADEAVLVPLLGLPPDRVPAGSRPAAAPPAAAGLAGTVWLDFSPGGGGVPGGIDPGEKGLPEVRVEVLRDGVVVATGDTDAAGRFHFPALSGTGYTVRLAASNFTEPFRGLTWLGPGLVTPAIIGAYIWVWAGFAMVVISAGLAGVPREVQDAARVDGASEWQVLRAVTVPLVRPVLAVVAVTLVINVLKIFDLVLVLAPESAQDDASVLGLEMYRVSFTQLNSGLGSALAVLLFLLVLPGMLYRVRAVRGERR